MKHVFILLVLLIFSESYAQLHISDGTELYVGEDYELYTNEDITNEGTLTFKPATEINFTVDAGLNNSSGTIHFNDATLVIGSGTTNANSTDVFIFGTNDIVKHLVLNKNLGTTTVNSGHLGIIETLKLTSGTLNAGERVSLKVSLNEEQTALVKEAYVVESTGGTANLRVEKFYPAKRAFRLVTSPVSGGTIHANWQNGGNHVTGIGTHITGGSGNTGLGFDPTGTNNPSMFFFDNGWQSVANTNATNLTAGVPYRLMVRGDRSVDLTNNNATPTPTVLTSTGTLLVGTVSRVFPSAVGGSTTFAFVANPYQSRIDVSSVLNANSNADNLKFWIWDPMINTRGGFVTIDELSGSGSATPPSNATKFIEPGQAFFIQVTESNPSIQFTESMKNVATSSGKVATLSDSQKSMLFELRNQDSQVIDAFRLRFDTDGDNGIDNLDAGKMGNLDENLASINENSLFSIQHRNYPENDEVIPLFTNNWRNENYSFKANLVNFEDINVYIIDNYLQSETLLENGQVYSFSVNSNITASSNPQRFALKFNPQTMGIQDMENYLFSMYPNPAMEVVNIQTSLPLGSQVSIEIYNTLGQKVLDEKQSITAPGLRLNVESLISGTYIVKLTDEEGNKQAKQLIKE